MCPGHCSGHAGSNTAEVAEDLAPWQMSVFKIFAIPVAERRVLLQATSVVLVVRVLLWLLPSRTIVRLARHIAARGARPDLRHASVPTIVWAVEAASRRIPRASCLTQALSAQLLLGRYGYDSRLCLGVAAGAARDFAAHAWLERQGRVIIGGSMSSTFVRLPDLAASRRERAKAQQT